MNVTVQLSEPLWREVGAREVALVIPSSSTVADLEEILSREYPEIADYLVGGELPPAVFLGDELAEGATPLTEGARVTFVWAAAGG
jgi:molybdopterin converting factor small subunit